jgi:hypothetical protein
MKKYSVQVVMSYVQTIDVMADNMHDAEQRAFEQFDLSKANKGEGDAWILDIENGEASA